MLAAGSGPLAKASHDLAAALTGRRKARNPSWFRRMLAGRRN
jgi:hypothetical protein